MIAGRLKPKSGIITMDGKKVKKLPKWKFAKNSLQIGYVPQRYEMEHGKMIIDILEKLAKPGFRKFKDRQDCTKRVQKVLGLTGLGGMEYKYPIELTYGERRRLELAGALINSPPVLVLDDITAGLDSDSMWDVYLLLSEISRMGITIIMATHSSFYVNMSRRRVVTLVHGRLYSDEEKGRFGEPKINKHAPQ